MCGRYTLRKGLAVIAEKLGDYEMQRPSISDVEPRFNIAPTQLSLVLRKSVREANALEPSFMRWGLVPSWSKTPQTQTPLINARSESVAEKPSYRAAFQRRRCLVPADGFYEWKKTRGTNQPFHFRMEDDSVFFMAGIWEAWIGEHNERIDSFTILTTQSNALMAKYHDRMPVILDTDRIPVWLETDVSKLTPLARAELFAPFDSQRMQVEPANPIVNNNRSEGPECLAAPSATPTSQLDLGF